MHCVQALWGPVAPATCTTALGIGDDACFSGTEDGSIVCWQQDLSSKQATPAAGSLPHSLQPVALLHQHAHRVVAVLPGLKDAESGSSSSSSFLLSLDAEGWVCLWDASSWTCVDSQRAAPLPPGASPQLLRMPDQQHVCVIIPATANAQHQQHAWQHQQQQQQHSSQHQLLQSAAAHAPMMLVLHWRSLALVAAPLVGPLGLVALTTSSSSSTSSFSSSSAHHAGQQRPDEIVAAAALNTAPALAPTAADTVVLAVTRSGVMYGGSMSGSSLPEAWQQPIAVGGSGAPLRQGCLRATTSSSSTRPSSAGSSSATDLQLQLLVVQPSGWRLFLCSTFSSTTGLPAAWHQVAAQHHHLLEEQLLHPSGLSPFAGLAEQQRTQGATSRLSHTTNRVRFSSVSSSGGDESCSSNDSSASCTDDEGAGDGGAAAESQAGDSSTDADPAAAAAAAGGGKRRRGGSKSLACEQHHQQQLQQAAVRLLGGMVMAGVPGRQAASSNTSSGGDARSSRGGGSETAANHFVAVVTWNNQGVQELWGVDVSLGASKAHQQEQQQHGSSITQQQQQPALLQTLQLQPWPYPAPAAAAQHAAAAYPAKVFAAVDPSHHRYALLSQHQSTLDGSCLMHQTLAQQDLLPDSRRAGDWHIHLCQLVQDAPHQAHHHHHQQQQQQHHHNHHRHPQQQQHSQQSQEHHQQQQHALFEGFRLHQVQGSWKAAWSRQHLYGGSSRSFTSQQRLSLHGVGQQVAAAAAGTAPDAEAYSSPSNGLLEAANMQGIIYQQQEQQQQQLPDQELQQAASSSSSSSSRKRPAAGGLVCDAQGHVGGISSNAEAVPGSAGAGDVDDVAGGSRAKHPRTVSSRVETKQQQAAVQAAAALQDWQQQKVTDMLLLGSDVPSVYQLAVVLESGAILFYDLASYCVPGSAWHPSTCRVAGGHVGPVTTTLQLVFRCPPQDLVACTTAAAGAEAAAAAAGVGAAGSHGTGSVSPGVQQHQQGAGESHQQQQHQSGGAFGNGSGSGGSPARCAGWSVAPACGGSVPLLLSGGADGSLCAWDLRVHHLGDTWMATHPHTAPVQSIVLPPVSSRLPWSACVLSVSADGVVCMSCLATRTTHRTFQGWGHGPPAQLAWSTSRGLLAAGGWDDSGLWQVTVWDAYSGQLDRQLSGPDAHMLMAGLSQELTSSMRHLKRSQQQQHDAVCTGAAITAAAVDPLHLGPLAAGALQQLQQQQQPGGNRSSLDVVGCSSSSSAHVTPRMQLVSHSSGPIRQLHSSRRDVLLLDIDVQQLLQALEAHTRQQQQQQRNNSRRQQQQVLGRHPGVARGSSVDGDSSSVSVTSLSRPSSLDLGSMAGGMDEAAATAAAACTSPPAPAAAGLSRQSSHSSHSQLSLTAAECNAHQHQTSSTGASQQQVLLHRRSRQLAPPVWLALQALCLLHRWGCDSEVDDQLVALLVDAGVQPAWPLMKHALAEAEHPAAAAAGGGGGGPQPSTMDSSSSISQWPRTAALPAAAPADGSRVDQRPLQHSTECQKEQLLLRQLQQLLQDLPVAGPELLHAAPCLSQEVQVSGNGALVLGMPAAKAAAAMWQQQQQQSRQEGSGQCSPAVQAGGVSPGPCAPSGVLLSAAPSLLTSRLLSLVAVSKWLMAPLSSTRTACNACSGLVTLYALHLPDLMNKATAAAAASSVAMMELDAMHSPRAASPAAAAAGNFPHATAAAAGAAGTAGVTSREQQRSQHKQQDAAGVVMFDLPLISSTSLAATGLMAEAAQLLLAALVHPAPPGSFPVPTLSLLPLPTAQQQQQQTVHDQHQQQLVFTAPGSAAAASCWPPAVLQLALLHHQQHGQRGQQQQQPQPLSLKRLPDWLPLLVLSAAAAVSHPCEVPCELLAAVSAGLIDVLLGAAPGPAAVVAGSWLCQAVLRSGHWPLWRPYIGKPAYLMHRLCYLVEWLRQGASSTELRTTTSSALGHTQHLTGSNTAAAAVGVGGYPAGRHSLSSGGSHTAAAAAPGSSSTGSGACSILAEQPAAIADPTLLMHGSNMHTQQQQQHIEGGLFISADMLRPAGQSLSCSGGSGQGWGAVPHTRPQRHTIWALEGAGTGAAAAVAAAAGIRLSGSAGEVLTSMTGVRYSYGSSGDAAKAVAAAAATGPLAAGAAGGLPPAHQPAAAGSHAQPQLLVPAAVHVGRAALVVWLRCVLDVFAALSLVDPAAVLNELSHKLADPAADSSSSLPLVMSGLARLLQRPGERPVLLPHLGFAAALAVQALDPSRPALRTAMCSPVTALVKELTSSFAQVACHSGSLQLAVGSTRPLGWKPKEASSSSSSGGDSGVVHWSGYDPVVAGSSGMGAGGAGGGGIDGSSSSRSGRQLSGELLQAAAAAVFDMNGGTKKKVLLLPVLLLTQTQGSTPGEQHQQPVGQKPHHLAPGGPVSCSSSTDSLASNGSAPAAGLAHNTLPGGIPGLWSGAKGFEGPGQEQAAAGVGGSSSSSISTMTGDGDGDAVSSSGGSLGGSSMGQLPAAAARMTSSRGSSTGMRAVLASNTLTRAEAAMVQHWFGGGTAGVRSSSSSGGGEGTSPLAAGAAAAAAVGGGHAPLIVLGGGRGPSSSGGSAAAGGNAVASDPSLWGVWRLHDSRSCYYPQTASAAQQPLLTGQDVVGGVAAVAFNPAGDAVVALLETCHCLVVWKLAASWSQKLSSFGSSRPSSHQPHAYIPVPAAAIVDVQPAGQAGGRHHHHQHSHTQPSGPLHMQGDVGGAEGQQWEQQHQQQHHRHHTAVGEMSMWQLKWQSERLIDLLYQGRPCACVEVAV